MLARVGEETARRAARAPVDPEALREAAAIVEDVRSGGLAALRRHSERLGDLGPNQVFEIGLPQLEKAHSGLSSEDRDLLARTADRIRMFAEAQLGSLQGVDVDVAGGRAGHRWVPITTVGAYAPGGRHPLPSTVLMTAIPAKVAGVDDLTVCSPHPTPLTLAAAHVGGADRLLALGGAQAIAALAFGLGCPPVDLVAGPGNRWVTAAKKHLVGEIGIDGLAGPSEIIVVADESADAALVACDLLAQAEHDPEAVPALITTSPALADAVDTELVRQLGDLSTADVAMKALGNGFCLVVDSLEDAAAVADHHAPEHLALHLTDAEEWAPLFKAYGSLFIGALSAEAFADYGIGPNHVLPTGRSARFQSGLSVTTYLRSPTWLTVSDPAAITGDVSALARHEGLEAHARAAERRGRPR